MGIKRAWTAAGLAVVLVVAVACSSPAEPEPNKGETAPVAADPNGSGTPLAQPALDPAFAVDAPGPREGSLEPSDMIVTGQEAFSEETVAALRATKGIERVDQFSYAQVPIENKALNLAAVDPSTYRNYTPPAAADLQEVWDRIAAGEIAVRPELRKQLPMNKAGFLRLGVKDDDPMVHVGAYAPTTPLVDGVVNLKYAEALGMPIGNALLISTGITSPQSMRETVQDLVGDGTSVQLTDVATREGIDPDVQQTAVLVGSVADVVGTFNYTVIGGGRIAPEASWVSSHVLTADVPILGTITCNRFVFPQLEAALSEIQARGLADKIHPSEYAGCYYPRFIAGSTTLSNHSFGLALDINTPGNQRGTVGEIDRTVVTIFKKWGFAWGGDWNYTDPMHFEMNALIDPR